MLGSRLGLAFFRILPNHWGWRALSDQERARILAANVAHNTLRPDYADPSLYQGGQNFDTEGDRRSTPRGRHVADFLDRVRPAHVLEVGPGAGYYTRMIVSHPAVREYTAVDLNPAFLDYLRPRLASMPIVTHFVHGALAQVEVRANAALLLSTVHHIHDRVALFRELEGCLTPGGAILAIDPAHYLLHIRKIWRKCLTPGYLASALRTENISTHNMCTLGEYQFVARETGLTLTSAVLSKQPRRLQRLAERRIPLGPLWRWLSQEIAVEFEIPAARQ